MVFSWYERLITRTILIFGGGVTGNMFEYFCRGERWADRFACTFWYLDRDVDPFLAINRWLAMLVVDECYCMGYPKVTW